jgi:hypothetical protein
VGLIKLIIHKVSQAQKKQAIHTEKQQRAKGQADALEGLGGSIGNAITGMKGMLKQLWLLVANQSVLTINRWGLAPLF